MSDLPDAITAFWVGYLAIGVVFGATLVWSGLFQIRRTRCGTATDEPLPTRNKIALFVWAALNWPRIVWTGSVKITDREE